LRATNAVLTVTLTSPDPTVTLRANGGSFGPSTTLTIAADTFSSTASIEFDYTGVAPSLSITLTASADGNKLTSTSVNITIVGKPADILAFSTTSTTGTDGVPSAAVNSGVAFTVTNGTFSVDGDLRETTATLTINYSVIGDFQIADGASAFGHLRATTAGATINLSVSGTGMSIVPNTTTLSTGDTHTTGNFTLNYSGDENDPFNVVVTASSAVYPYSTSVTVNFDPKEATKLAFSVNNGNTSATSGFNGGNLTVTEGAAVPVTVSSFSPDDWFRQTSANVDVTISVNAGVQVRQSGGAWGSSTSAQLAANTYQVSYNLEFRYVGTPVNTVATVTASAAGYPVSTTISITINGPAVRLAYSSTSSFGTDGFDTYPNPIMEDQPFTVTTGSFSLFGELRNTSANTTVNFSYAPSAAISSGFSASPASTTLTAGSNYVETSMVFGYTGPATMGTVQVTAASVDYPYSTTLTVTFYAN